MLVLALFNQFYSLNVACEKTTKKWNHKTKVTTESMNIYFFIKKNLNQMQKWLLTYCIKPHTKMAHVKTDEYKKEKNFRFKF